MSVILPPLQPLHVSFRGGAGTRNLVHYEGRGIQLPISAASSTKYSFGQQTRLALSKVLQASTIDMADRGYETFVDSDDESDSSSRHSGNDVRATHEDSFDDVSAELDWIERF